MEKFKFPLDIDGWTNEKYARWLEDNKIVIVESANSQGQYVKLVFKDGVQVAVE